jgi:membrane protease YdiL (CAAX protease family)
MTSYDHFIKLLVLIGFILGGLMLTALVSAVIMLIGGISVEEIMEMSRTGTMDFTPGLTRALLATQHLLTFIIPGLAFGFVFYRSAFLTGLDLSKNPGWLMTIMGILFLIAAYPLVNLSFLVNEAIPLPAWASSFEDQAEDTLMAILNMNSVLIFLANLLIIALLPGIGEELIFRGVLQKQIGLLLRNPVVAIWISAFIFSAIHLQFEGFLPRMILGAVLGYLYYWTGNLWVPVIAHAFNNGIQVILIYVTGMDISSFDEKSSDQLQWWMIPLSIAAMYGIYTTLLKNRRFREQV